MEKTLSRTARGLAELRREHPIFYWVWRRVLATWALLPWRDAREFHDVVTACERESIACVEE